MNGEVKSLGGPALGQGDCFPSVGRIGRIARLHSPAVQQRLRLLGVIYHSQLPVLSRAGEHLHVCGVFLGVVYSSQPSFFDRLVRNNAGVRVFPVDPEDVGGPDRLARQIGIDLTGILLMRKFGAIGR